MYLLDFAIILNILEQLGMVTSGDSDDKILLFNSNGPPEPNRILFWENPLTKNFSYKENYLINKVKCVIENDNHKIWRSNKKLLFWFSKGKHWVEIK